MKSLTKKDIEKLGFYDMSSYLFVVSHVWPLNNWFKL